ncbi:GGDEF domain-containing protein [Ancylobacter sp. TS-1]|uniref:sensor domain-containing diguanylate cyclase n=1 Tax=Ancylobacter sp. TS-1 TaxID=1850374 RepID=UPI001265C66D|nr:GGDEF domain-containing protein [Ancylobacter sp. TS-1]QFR33914.1 diguanylate cyclase [Ancylobacter sp. TS-1]
MALIICERSVSLVQLHYDNIEAAKSRVMQMLDGSITHYEAAIDSAQAVMQTLIVSGAIRPPPPLGLPADAQSPPPSDPDPALTPELPGDCHAFPRVLESFSTIESLTIVATNGVVLCGTAPGSAGIDLSGRDYVRIALRGLETVEAVHRSYVTHRPTLYAARPITAPGYKGVTGVLIARLSSDELFPPSVFAELGAGTQAIVVSPEGVVVQSYPDDLYGLGLDISDAVPVARALSRSRGTVIAGGPDGVQRVYAFARLPGTNMHLLIGLDQTRVLGPVEWATWSAGLTMLSASLIILIGLSLIGERLIVAPVQSLADRLVRFGRGDSQEPASRRPLITELQPLVSAFENMTIELTRREAALRYANRRLNSLASLDPLTGIANRRSFDAALSLQWNSTDRLAMLMIDIDRFKSFNDVHGHQEGDRCLRLVAQTMTSAIRGSDLVARIGGEEFAVLMPGASLRAAADVAERVRQAVEALAIGHRDGVGGVVTISIGAAACEPAPSLMIADLVMAADGALYAAKRAGRNTVCAADGPELDAHPAGAAAGIAPDGGERSAAEG